jgi:hypothetical protein
MIWRADIVRLLPQTATFYKMVGLEVNLRGLTFKDIKVTNETVDGKPVLVIEGVIVGETRKPVELPRLRFSVRDAQGTEIYAWNAVLEQPVLNPVSAPISSRAWRRRRPKAVILMYAFSTSGTWPATPERGQLCPAGRETRISCRAC